MNSSEPQTNYITNSYLQIDIVEYILVALYIIAIIWSSWNLISLFRKKSLIDSSKLIFIEIILLAIGIINYLAI